MLAIIQLKQWYTQIIFSSINKKVISKKLENPKLDQLGGGVEISGKTSPPKIPSPKRIRKQNAEKSYGLVCS